MAGLAGSKIRSYVDSRLFVPLIVNPQKANDDALDVGSELTEVLDRGKVMKALTKFYRRKQIQRLGEENGLDARLFHQAFVSFRKYILESEMLPPDLHIIVSDITAEAGHVDDMFPYFMRHAKQIFPMLDCMDDLRKISDLRNPANWYPEARAIERKFIFHAGPTNSGKTYQALKRFNEAESGVYCGPLKLLANEIHQRTNEFGTPCDLVTGEERRYANEDGTPSNHVSCTVEMASVTHPYEVAVIDEIQMIRDTIRGWAWTRTVLGICAKEIHVCGEEAAFDLISRLVISAGDNIELRKYDRLTPLTIQNEPLGSCDNVRPGDCIVAFSKNDIFKISRQIEGKGEECAVIYGALPPGTKLAQAQRFNDPDDSCKILVATDAIGMGINLSIRRIILNTLTKPMINEKGEREMDLLTTSHALQIAGRAGRYGSHYPEGEVTTMNPDDLTKLKIILGNPVESITEAGLHPTAEQIELFAYHLPDATLSNLIDIFVDLAQVEGYYFVCNIDDFKFLADLIQHVPLPLRDRYVFCCAPANRKHPFVCTSFLKFARQYSRNEVLTGNWISRMISWPLNPPKTLKDLLHLEGVHDVLDLYLWLSYRFPDLFLDSEGVREMQRQLDVVIQDGVERIVKLIRASSNGETHQALSSPDSIQPSPAKTAETTDADDMKHAIRSSRKRPGRDSKNDQRSKKNSDRQHKQAAIGGLLTKKLISKGVLTPEMVEELQHEWKQSADSKTNNNTS